VALTQEAVSNEGDAWNLTLDEIELYFDRVLSQRLASPPPGPPASLVEAARQGPPPALQELVGRYFSLARQLGQRTADVHRVMMAGHGDPAFVPEPFTAQHQQSIFQWSHVRLVRLFETLRRRLGSLPPQTRELAAALIPQERTLDDRLRRVVGRKIEVSRIRCHGDLHLGQVLFTGDDFVIIDFEGEPARPTVERRYKRCALRDAMGIVPFIQLRGGGGAAQRAGAFGGSGPAGPRGPRPGPTGWVPSTWGSYLQGIAGTPLAPRSDDLVDLLLGFYELEKVVYEVEYELNNRPDWLHIPLAGMNRILQRRP
jgi:maltose alpha-D-glucosyltransferase/alpha-amylase